MSKIMVTQSSMPVYEDYAEKIKKIWDTRWLTNMGEYHVDLQNRLKQYLDVPNLDLFVNGHMALELALQAFNLSGEVITTPFTFASTTHAIVRNGLTPVFCDINEDDYTMDVSCIEKLITDRTTAIVPVHVYGTVCNVEEISRIANKYGLKVIYDAAHAFGVKYKGKGIGNYGDAAMYSFHATKVFNTIEGGAVVYKDNQVGEKLRRLKNFGIKDEEVVDDIGANAKMNEFSAAMGLCNLDYVDGAIEARGKLVDTYREMLEGITGIQLPIQQKDVVTNNAYFPIVVDEKKYGYTRNELVDELKENGIYARKYFYPLTNTFDCFHGKFSTDTTPIALKISKRVLTLPLYADLEQSDVRRICEIVVKKGKN